MKEATVEELGLDPSVRSALQRLLGDLDVLLPNHPVTVVVYPDPDPSTPDSSELDLFLVTDAPWEPGGPLTSATTRIREETGVHIGLHRLAPHYLEEIRRENTAFYQDLEQHARRLKSTRTPGR